MQTDQPEKDRTRLAAEALELVLTLATVVVAWFWIAVPLADWAISYIRN